MAFLRSRLRATVTAAMLAAALPAAMAPALAEGPAAMPALFIDAASPADPLLYFGSAGLGEDDAARFEALWEIRPEGDECAMPESDFILDNAGPGDFVIIGDPAEYGDLEGMVSKVTATLLLSAGEKEVEMNEPLLACTVVFLTNYHALYTE